MTSERSSRPAVGPATIARPLGVFCAATFAVAWMTWNETPGRSILAPMVWVLAAWLPMARDRWLPRHLGLTGPELVRGLRYYALTTLVLVPVLGGGFWLYGRAGLPLHTAPSHIDVPMWEWIVYQLVVIAVSEELFFRGYLQGRLEQIASQKGLRAGGVLWLPIAASALFFALAHVVVDLSLARLAVVMPGLLFAWLRGRSGSLLAPMLAHGTANVLAMLAMAHVSSG